MGLKQTMTEKYPQTQSSVDKTLYSLRILSALGIMIGCWALLFEIYYFREFSIAIYFARISFTIIALIILALSFRNNAGKYAAILTHIILLSLFSSFVITIYKIPATVFINSQILSLLIFTSALIFSWETKHQIIAAIYFNVLYAVSIIFNDPGIYRLPNLFACVLFVCIISFLSVAASLVIHKLRDKLLQESKNREEAVSQLLKETVEKEIITQKALADNIQKHESSARLSELIKNIASGILVEDENRRIIVVNSDFCQIFGIHVDPVDLEGADCSMAAQQSKHLFDDPEKFISRVTQILLERKLVKNEELKLADGRIFERDYVPIFSADDYKGHLWNYRDITSRKKNELILQQERQLLKTIIDNIPDAIYVKDKEGRKIMANKAEMQILGVENESDVIGHYDTEFYLPEISAKTKAEDDLVITTGKPVLHSEGFVISKMGQTQWFIGNKVPFSDPYGNIIGLVGISHDITDRKYFETELINLKAFYEQTLNDLSAQVAVLDANYKYVYINPSSVADAEVRNWLIGKDDYDYCDRRSVARSVADQRRKWLVEAMNKKEQIRFEEEFKRDDGTVRYFERKISPILNSENEVTRLVAYGVDITDIKSLVRNLEYSNKSLTDFAYIASHDLREPLRKISAFGSLLSKSLRGTLDSDNQENLDFMIDGARRMQQMVDDLLLYSRITAKAKSLALINIDEVLTEIISFDLAETIEDNNAKIIVENKIGSIRGEKSQIKSLIQNLIGNGIKYRKKEVSPVIKISSQMNSFEIKMRIEDNGIGIDEKYKDQIFEMFKRLHSKEEYEGSGIGLAVCKKIIELYGGEISLHSVLGEGSAFTIKLPLERR